MSEEIIDRTRYGNLDSRNIDIIGCELNVFVQYSIRGMTDTVVSVLFAAKNTWDDEPLAFHPS